MTTVYNNDWYISHFYCEWTCMHHVYTQKCKIQNLWIFQQFVKYVKRKYECKIKIIWLNEEIALLKNFENWALNESYIIKRALSYMKKQNNFTKWSKKMIIKKNCCIQITANLSENLWLKSSKSSDYFLNWTFTKKLEWKILLKKLYFDLKLSNSQFYLTHLEIYNI